MLRYTRIECHDRVCGRVSERRKQLRLCTLHASISMQVLRFVLGVVLPGAASGAASSPGCPDNPPDPSSPPPPAENCAKFCSGACPYHPDYSPGKPVNLTLFRLTANKMLPLGAGNKDTGDAPGDVGFYMQRFMQLVNCTPPWTRHGCFLDEDPVIQQFVIEADGLWG
jgi:hypothetical protein